jgi:hypothetical protein
MPEGKSATIKAAPNFAWDGINFSASSIVRYRVVPAVATHVELENLDGTLTRVFDPKAVKECARADNKLDQYLATPEARAIITHANRNLAMGTPMVRSAGGGTD